MSEVRLIPVCQIEVNETEDGWRIYNYTLMCPSCSTSNGFSATHGQFARTYPCPNCGVVLFFRSGLTSLDLRVKEDEDS